MITADRRCDVCGKRAIVRATGMRWLCRRCWPHVVDLPWEVRS